MLHIEEILQRHPNGATKPFLCVADDENKYYVKGLNATFDGLIAEWVCYQLAKSFELVTPHAELMEVPFEMLEIDIDYQFSLGEGVLFGSQVVPFTIDVPNISSISSVKCSYLKHLLLFDRWICNGDRTMSARGGRANLLLNSVGDLFVFDHNLALDASEILNDDWKQYHITVNALADWEPDLLDIVRYQDMLKEAIGRVEGICDTVPQSWWERAKVNTRASVSELLTRDVDEFIGGLRK
jgi:hypothetical protein